MIRVDGHKALFILFVSFVLFGITAAAAPDPRLYRLIPPDSALVNGMDAPSNQGESEPFLLVNHYNNVDLEDFLALTGADDTLTIRQIIFVARGNIDGQMNEHSLLASGHFDQPHLFKSAAGRGAAVTNYGGIPVLEIRPFARELGTFKHVRWLAVLDSNVLVFGTIATTQIELNRYLLQNHADEPLLRRLARLRGKDQIWCLLSRPVPAIATPAQQQEIYTVLEKLSPELGRLARSAKELEFGIHYGRKVEIEYEASFASAGAGRVGPDSLRLSPVEPGGSASLLPTLGTTTDTGTLHGLIAMSMSRYKTWLSGVSARGFDQVKATPNPQ